MENLERLKRFEPDRKIKVTLELRPTTVEKALQAMTCYNLTFQEFVERAIIHLSATWTPQKLDDPVAEELFKTSLF